MLFTGTPCQVAAIKCIAEKEKASDNLICVEILCYGVPSPEIFKEHLSMIEKKYGLVKSYMFRDERNGWGHDYIHSAKLEHDELYNHPTLQAYASLFGKRLVMRKGCFECKFSCTDRCADITIGDCWGIEYIDEAFNDGLGVSQVWINSEKGSKLWQSISLGISFKECQLTDLLEFNTVLSHPAEKPDDYEDFWEYYNNKGYEKTLKKYTRYGKTYRFRYKMKRLLHKMHI